MNQPHTWLYSIAAEQHIVVECDGRHEQGGIIKNTGKIILKGKCKLTTSDMTIQSTEVIFQTETETYLPEANITLLRDQKPLTNNKTLDSVLQHRAELGELKTKLEKINNNIENSEQKFFMKKQFICPMASSGIITIIVSSNTAPVLGHYLLVSGGGVRVSDVTRGMTSRGEGEGSF